MRIVISLAGLMAVAIAVWVTVETRRNRLVWDHFDVVKPGILYRSGQLNSDQLADVVAKFGVRTVINFQIPGDGVELERAAARRLQIDFVNLPMPGDGLGEEWQFREVLKILDDPDRRPVLVHCARGTCRTGAAVAFYRFERDGWTPEDVASELRRQTYHYGLVPGYIYAMVKTKPSTTLLRSEMLIDRNLATGVPRKEAVDER
jgi:protein-tyrosine phosphatase